MVTDWLFARVLTVDWLDTLGAACTVPPLAEQFMVRALFLFDFGQWPNFEILSLFLQVTKNFPLKLHFFESHPYMHLGDLKNQFGQVGGIT